MKIDRCSSRRDFLVTGAAGIMEDLTLTPEERRDLRLGETKGLSSLYCQQCARCLPQCPASLEIPTLMRASMYALGYHQPKKALATMRGWPPADILCKKCSSCTVQCTLGLDVKSQALDMARLLDSQFLDQPVSAV